MNVPEGKKREQSEESGTNRGERERDEAREMERDREREEGETERTKYGKREEEIATKGKKRNSSSNS